MEERPETRVLIVDDRPAFSRQLTRAGLSVVGEAGDIPEAEAQVQSLQPDLAVVDVMLPGANGIEGTPRLRALVPGTRVILVSAYRDRAGVYQTAASAVGARSPRSARTSTGARRWLTLGRFRSRWTFTWLCGTRGHRSRAAW